MPTRERENRGLSCPHQYSKMFLEIYLGTPLFRGERGPQDLGILFGGLNGRAAE